MAGRKAYVENGIIANQSERVMMAQIEATQGVRIGRVDALPMWRP
jgi:hypothetical protein